MCGRRRTRKTALDWAMALLGVADEGGYGDEDEVMKVDCYDEPVSSESNRTKGAKFRACNLLSVHACNGE